MSVPDNVKRPMDHLKAVEAEAAEDMAVVEHNGITFTFPANPLDWPNVAVLAFEEGKALTALRAILGPDVYAKIASWTMRQTTGLLEAVAEKAGFSASGN